MLTKEFENIKGDYKDRMGLTQNPISAYNVATFPIACYCLKVASKLNAGFTSWKEDQKQKTKKKEAKMRIIAMIKAKSGIAVDMPEAVGAGGTSTTGNTARALLYDHQGVRCLLNVSHKRLGEIKNVTGLHMMNSH